MYLETDKYGKFPSVIYNRVKTDQYDTYEEMGTAWGQCAECRDQVTVHVYAATGKPTIFPVNVAFVCHECRKVCFTSAKYSLSFICSAMRC